MRRRRQERGEKKKGGKHEEEVEMNEKEPKCLGKWSGDARSKMR